MRKIRLLSISAAFLVAAALAHGAHLEIQSIMVLPSSTTTGFLKVRVLNHENTTNTLQAFASSGVKFTLEKKVGGVYQKTRSWPIKPGLNQLNKNTLYRVRYTGTFQKTAKGIPITVMGSGMVTTVMAK